MTCLEFLYIPYARHYITLGLYIFNPIFEFHFFVLKGFFFKKFCAYVWLVFNSRLWWRSYGKCNLFTKVWNTIPIYSSKTSLVAYSFQGKIWYVMDLRCSSIFSDNETLINVHCNTTNEEITFKRPEEGTKQCIQTIQVC